MKTLVKYSSLVLLASGYVLSFAFLRDQDLLVWIHILLGFGYTVLFLLFSFDHVMANKDKLLTLSNRSVIGTLQLSLGAVVLITGFVIYLYGSKVISPWSEIHFWSTLGFTFSSFFHFFTR